MKGFIYRMGIKIRDIGERLNRIKICNIYIFYYLSYLLNLTGLVIKDSALKDTSVFRSGKYKYES